MLEYNMANKLINYINENYAEINVDEDLEELIENYLDESNILDESNVLDKCYSELNVEIFLLNIKLDFINIDKSLFLILIRDHKSILDIYDIFDNYDDALAKFEKYKEDYTLLIEKEIEEIHEILAEMIGVLKFVLDEED